MMITTNSHQEAKASGQEASGACCCCCCLSKAASAKKPKISNEFTHTTKASKRTTASKSLRRRQRQQLGFNELQIFLLSVAGSLCIWAGLLALLGGQVECHQSSNGGASSAQFSSSLEEPNSLVDASAIIELRKLSPAAATADEAPPADPLLASASRVSSVRSTRQLAPNSAAAASLLSASSEAAAAAATSQPTLDSSADELAADTSLMQQPFDYHSSMPVITKRELANAIKQATASVRKLTSGDQQAPTPTVNSGGGAGSMQQMEAGSASWLANSMLHKQTLDSQALNQSEQALISEEATRWLVKQYKLNRAQTLRGLPLISVDQTNLGKLCQRSARAFNCLAGRYRSLTGHCNNVQQPDWGSAQTALLRYAPAHYTDSIARPPRAAAKQSAVAAAAAAAAAPPLLPSARAVSVAVHEAAGRQQPQPQSHMTTMMSFFGQFVFHDLTYVSQYSGGGGGGGQRVQMDCCAAAPTGRRHPECMPIELQEDDFCLNYVRSMPAIRAGCNLGPRDQLNLVSSFLDGSMIYGSSEEQMRRLRTFQGGRLRSQRALPVAPSSGGGGQPAAAAQQPSPPLELLPAIELESSGGGGGGGAANWRAAADDCKLMAQMKRKRNPACFEAGDDRANENIGLTLMHTIWMREHNYIADGLAHVNRHWRDERLFEEARRILIAELQLITYNEFLPTIIGDEIMQRFNLTTQSQGYFQNYDPSLNAGISNELAAAVLPFILSTIPSALERYSDRLEMLGSTNVADTFMDGSDLFKRNKFAQYLMGMISQNAMEPAHGLMPMTKEMHAMAPSSSSSSSSGRSKRQAPSSSSAATDGGELEAHATVAATEAAPLVDILALTVQQGRDHGLKPYLYWRQVCQLKPVIRNWADLSQVMPATVVERLKQVYASVHQIDLYLAVLESPLAGATVGPTFVCLLARQFFHLKHGDRYWFENDLPGTSFTPQQLEQIRQTSLAKVMCRNSQSTISFIQPSPMIASDPYLNAYQYCTNKAMSNLDLSKWHQPVTSAQQFQDELTMNELSAAAATTAAASTIEVDGDSSPSVRSKRFVRSIVNDPKVITTSLQRAKRQLDTIAYDEIVHLRRMKRSPAAASGGGHHHHHVAAAYRYLPRLKRQALRINNQSLIFELATNEVVRSLLHQGKDREMAKSLQNDIRDFLYSLEGIQLDNLLDNSGGSANLNNFIANAGNAFLTNEQRNYLATINDQTLNADLPFASSDLSTALGDAGIRSSSVSTNCQDDDRAIPCDHTSPFRTITGWCNNLNNPKFGQSFTPLDRVLPNAYEDGLSRPRLHSIMLANQETGDRLRLPSARLISTTMHDDRSNLHTRYSLALMQFGQFGVDHDLTRTPFAVALDGSLLDCSPCDATQSVHRECLPIEIPDNDYHFNSARARELTGTGKKCLHFVRSLNGQTGLGPRQQINALTAYIDGSNIYGSDNCEAKSLRAFVGGRLNSSSVTQPGQQPSRQQQHHHKEILPVTRANPECVTPNGFCFHAGDQRASEQPGLTAIHTSFMRLHNMIVGQLAQVNKHWNDELLYQHGRRIVGAISQRITYNEFAPRLLGLDYMSKFDLMLKQVGYSDQYDDSCSASILTEFAAAAFRMGHSLIRNAFPLLDKQYKPIGKAFQLRKAFFNSQRIMTEPNLIDTILRGIVSTPIESLDNSITEELTNHLFERPKEPFSGMDLISLNIQRARDHGISSYNDYRVKCNLTRAKTFDDLTGEIPERLVKRLKGLYASVDDIDLFPGGLSETPVHGGIIGPTFGCIIGMQFSRLKKCDRFWHETGDPYVRFSPPQLAEIRKMTLAKVICQTSDTIDTIQRNAMDVPDHYLNPRVPCTSLPSMDIAVWRENSKSCLVNKIKLDLGTSKRINPCKSCTCTLEGPICRTAKINCVQLMKRQQLGKLNFSQIMQDKSCLIQCAWLLDVQPLAV